MGSLEFCSLDCDQVITLLSLFIWCNHWVACYGWKNLQWLSHWNMKVDFISNKSLSNSCFLFCICSGGIYHTKLKKKNLSINARVHIFLHVASMYTFILLHKLFVYKGSYFMVAHTRHLGFQQRVHPPSLLQFTKPPTFCVHDPASIYLLNHFQKPPLAARPTTKPRDHGTPKSHNHWL